MQDKLRLALIQDNPETGDIGGNAEMVLAALETHKDADLIVFSECFLTGYPVQDLVLRPGFIRSVEESIHTIRDAVIAANGPAILLGAPQAGAILPYNAAYLIEPSGAMRIVRKSELPNADVFDERRTFAMSNEPRPAPLQFRGFNLGIQICEDMWHGAVSQSLASELADVLLVINGSPYQGGKQAVRMQNARARIRATGLPLIYVNQVGGQDELVFDGASFTMNVDGGTMTARAFAPDVLKMTLNREADGSVRIGADLEEEDFPYPTDTLQTDYQACVLALRDYVRKSNMPRVFLGISGGLDSALVATMAADALGPRNVFGVMLPSQHTGEESLGLANALMMRLEINSHTIPIGSAYEAVDGKLTNHIDVIAAKAGVKRVKHDLARENYQARLRGLYLMGLSNALGGMVLSTGNKSEMSVGYATLYGDMAGGYNPLKSVWKTDAFRMARWRNTIDPEAFGFLGAIDPIPTGIIDRPPTAELAEGQADANTLGEYEALDCVLKAMIEDRQSPEAAARTLERTFTAKELERLIGEFTRPEGYCYTIARLVRNAQYKRVQAAPGTVLRLGDFGPGFRYPVAGGYSL